MVERNVRQVTLSIDGRPVGCVEGLTVLEVARRSGIDIPALCSHPALAGCGACATPSPEVFWGAQRIKGRPGGLWDGCGLCVVSVDGAVARACRTEVREGMTIVTHTQEVVALRRERLGEILATHPHACLTCAQAEGCSRTQCSSNVPEDERCCELLGACELGRIAAFIGIAPTVPRYRPRGYPALTTEPLFDFRPELCIGCLRCVRVCSDLRGVGALGFVMHDGQPVVGMTAPTRERAGCRLCGACVAVCPTGALVDRSRAGGGVPCREACPVGIDIPRLLRHVAALEPGQASAVIRERVPLAFAASYVCFHPCEEACRRGEVNEPISVCRLKRFAVDRDDGRWRSRLMQSPATGKRVAVIGAGPAGLTAAYYLARKGPSVTVFESLPEPGGMLRYGIPEYRLPREVLDRDIAEVRRAGVEVRCGEGVDAERFPTIVSDHDAVFVATGAHVAKRLVVPGCDLDGVYWGVDLLRERASGRIPSDRFFGRKVVVIGGGNVAVDVGRVALRLGAAKVDIVSLEQQPEVPAWPFEVVEALEEGVEWVHSRGPKAIAGQDGHVAGVVLRRCTRVFDELGRFSPQFEDEDTVTLPADAVILAIGQEPSSAPFASLGLARDGTILHDHESLATHHPKVFVGGDVAKGPRSFIEAVAEGRLAASGIDRALGGDGRLEEVLADHREPSPFLGRVDGFGGLGRVQPRTLEGPERIRTFSLRDETLQPEAARAEAIRCLQCDLRARIPASPMPPRAESLWPMTREVIASIPEAEGVFEVLDAERRVLAIRGVANLRQALLEMIEEKPDARYFVYELEPMYTKRESEWLQRYLKEHGEMPGGGSELDDLF